MSNDKICLLSNHSSLATVHSGIVIVLCLRVIYCDVSD